MVRTNLILGDEKLSKQEINDLLKRRAFYSNSKDDIKESSELGKWLQKGYIFIKENIWFLRK
jgi:hypothetical protein